MRFHGLFIGADRYQSPDIRWLSSAVRDAKALSALFADNFSGDSRSLTDSEATLDAIRAELDRLATVSGPEDLVVVSHSGHGSSTHELIPYDADRRNLAETALPLAELAERLNKISAANLLCILDCCFAGGLEAKFLASPAVERSLQSEFDALEQITGEGRIVLTAAAANEPAYEDHAAGHGLLTHYLLQGFQGAPEALASGRVDLHRLIRYVTERVIDASASFRNRQHPTLRGSLDGLPRWPVMKPGDAYTAAFPERIRQPATADLQSLQSFNLPTSLLDAWATAIPALNDLQLAAINDYGLLDGSNLLVTAPTSSGKTMVGELAALQRVVDRRRALFLLPMRAIVNDKYTEFTAKYGPVGVTTIRATGEISDDIPALMSGRYDICLMTYEKFGALALANPWLLRQVGTIVVDEVQMLVDPNRGAGLEFILTLLRARRGQGIRPQVICLSAVIGDSGGLERWLDGRQLRHEARPVPLVEGLVDASGQARYLDEQGVERSEPGFLTPHYSGKFSSQDVVIPLVAKLVGEGKQVIVFREKKGETVGCAGYLAATLGLPPAKQALDALPAGDPSTSSAQLRHVLRGGVAFHNADLDREERQVLEAEFRRGDTLRVLVATTTLAMGVNTPASAVVIVGLTHPGPAPKPYTVAEYKNMVGRAGRLGFAERGESYVIAAGSVDAHSVWARYVRGRPEDLRSVFMDAAADPRTLVLRTLAALEPGADGSVETELLVSFLESSFAAFQRRQVAPDWRWQRAHIVEALRVLSVHSLVEQVEGDRYRLTELGRFAGEAGFLVDSIIRLVEVLRPLQAVPTSTTLMAAAQVTRELDELYLPLNRRGFAKERQSWFGGLSQQQADPAVLHRLHVGAPDDVAVTARAKRAFASALWASSTPLADLERWLTRHLREDGGVAGAVRQVASRTRDVLPAVERVFEFLHTNLPVADLVARTMVRMELGIPAELVDLAQLLGGSLTRSQYLTLRTVGITSPSQFTDASADDLANHLRVTFAQANELQERARVQKAQQLPEQQLPLPTE